MRAIKIKYNGSDDTRILFREETSDKLLQIQKYLLNVATEKNTDFIFPDRGTDLLRTALGGALITNNGVRDGFAAVDTLYFCNYEDAADVYKSANNVMQFTLLPGNYRHASRQLSFAANFTFRDGTIYNTNLELANNG